MAGAPDPQAAALLAALEAWDATTATRVLEGEAAASSIASPQTLIAAMQPATSTVALRPGVLKDGRVNYVREGRQFGRPASYQTSSMRMHEQAFGALAYH